MGVTAIRAATAADHADYARLFPALGVPEAPPTFEHYSAAILPDASVAVGEDGRVCGVIWARPRGPALHVVHLIVDSEARGRGVGRALLQAAAARGRAAGLTRWFLNVKPDNAPARALYRAMGFADVFLSCSMRVDADVVALLAHAPGPIRVEPLPHEVEALPTLGLALGEPAAMRALPGRCLFGASADGAWVGVAGFDPGFPGASPFRCAGPGVARALLDACFAAARPGTEALFVHVEGDARLEAELIAAGAVPAMRVVRMEGEMSG